MKFNADTTKVTKQVKTLQESLSKIMQMKPGTTAFGTQLTSQLQQASGAAAQLKVHLQSAFNQHTGKLDLVKFNQAIKSSGMTLQGYKAALAQAGPIGQQAFNQLAMSITMAEIPLIRVSNKLAALGVTLANTARWQLSSSLVTGFISGISKAYRYVQDLDESLTNIRIVTGYSADYMERFAEKANKAAQALRTTTNEYAKASLIYFQQGLNDAEVEKRTNTTIKLANVTGESVETISDQLTAVWNNFDNGSKSLEYYVDVITALGAATASSTDEITQGLEKFASIAQTVGLTYEYATSALATVTAATRQSADVVGTAFKTLFARIQDLELGNTLDDGTTIGTYSEALRKVGIEVLDTNGSLRTMNDILDEMGAKWDTFSQAQQMALAQSVAGVRQYTYLISLMENWDQFQQNVNVAQFSEGTLNQQAEIYAESWQAARDEVTAAMEDIYSKLLDDKAFKDILEFLADMAKNISNVIDNVGGLQGVLVLLGTVLTRVFGTQIANGLTSTAQSLMLLTKSGQEAMRSQQRLASQLMAETYGKTGITGVQGKAIVALSQAQQEYQAQVAKMNPVQKQIAENLLNQKQLLIDAVNEQAKLTSETERTLRAKKNNLLNETRDDPNANVNNMLQKQQQSIIGQGVLSSVDSNALQELSKNGKITSETMGELQSRLKHLGITSDQVETQLADMIGPELSNQFQNYSQAVDKAKRALQQFEQNATPENEQVYTQAIKEMTRQEELLAQSLQKVAQDSQPAANGLSLESRAVQEARTANENFSYSFLDLLISSQEAGQGLENFGVILKKNTSQVVTFSQNIVNAASGLGSLFMGLNALKGSFDILGDEELSAWDKFLSIMTTMLFTLPMLVNGFKMLKDVQWKSIGTKVLDTTTTILNTLALKTNAKYRAASKASADIEQKEMTESAAAKTADTAATVANNAVNKKSGGNINNGVRQINMKNGQVRYQNASTGKFMKTSEGAKLFGGKAAGSAAAGGAGSAASSLGSAFVGALPAIGAFAAAAAIVATVVIVANNQLNKHEERVKDAKVAVEQLTTAYNDAKAEYDDFTSTLNSYKDGVEGLEELTKGTVEYREAIVSANQEALKLIENHKNLKYSINSEGLIVIDEKSLQEAQEKELYKLQQSQSALATGRLVQSQAEGNRDKVNFTREELYSKEDLGWKTANIGTSAAAGAGAGALIGSVVPVIGTAIGAVVGGIVGLIGGAIASDDVSSDSEMQAIDKLTEYVQKNGNEVFNKNTEDFKKFLAEDLELDDTALINALSENKSAVHELTQVELARLAKEDAEWANAFINANAEGLKDVQSQGYVAAKASQEREALEAEGLAKIEELFQGGDEDAAEAYLKMMYGDDAENYKVEDLSGDYWTLKKKNEDGTWETVGEEDSLSEEDVKAQYKTQYAIQSFDSEEIKNIDKEYKKLANSLSLAGIKSEELQESIASSYAKDSAIDLSSLTYNEILKLDVSQLEKGLQEPIKKAIETYKNNLPEFVSDMDFDAWYNELSSKEQEFFWTIKLDENATLDQVKSIYAQAKEFWESQEMITHITGENEFVDFLKEDKRLGTGEGEGWQAFYDNINKYVAQENERDENGELTTEAKQKYAKMSNEEILAIVQSKQSTNIIQSGQNLDESEQALIQEEKNLKLEAEKQSNIVNGATTLYNQKITAGDNTAQVANGILQTFKAYGVETASGNYDNFMDSLKYKLKGYVTDDFLNQLTAGYADVKEGKTTDNAIAWNDFIAKLEYTSHSDNLNDEFYYAREYGELGELTRNADWAENISDVISKYSAYGGEVDRLKENLSTEQDKLDSIVEDIGTNDANQIENAQNYAVWVSEFQKFNEDMGLDTKAISEYADSLEVLADTTGYVDKSLVDNEQGLLQVAQAAIRVNTGIESLSNGFEDWVKVLYNGSKTSPEYIKALDEMATSVSHLLTVQKDQINQNFIVKHLDQIKLASQGNAEAIEFLREELSKDIILQVTGHADFSSLSPSLQELSNNILNWSVENELQVGARIDDATFLNQLQQLQTAAKMTQEQMQNYLNSLGYVGYFTEGKISGAMYTGAAENIINDSNKIDKKATEDKKKDLNKEIDRYHQIKEELSDIKRYYDEITKAKDRAFGPDKLAYLSQEKAMLEENIDAQNRYIDEITSNLSNDRNTMAQYGASTDEFGRITNYEDLIAAQVAEYNKVVESGDEDAIAEADKKYQQFQNDLKQYEETLNLLEEEKKNLTDLTYKQIDNALETVTTNVEYSVGLIDNSIKHLEHQFNNLSDPIFDAAEAMATLGDIAQQNLNKTEKYQQALKDTLLASKDFTETDVDALLSGDMSVLEGKTLTQEQVNMLQEYRDSLYESNDQLRQLGDQIHEKLVGSFTTFNERMKEQGAIIEHNGSILESYNNIIDLVGKKALGLDNSILNTLNRAMVSNSQSELNISKATLDANRQTLADLEKEYSDTMKKLSEENKTMSEEDKQRWKDSIKTAKEAVETSETDFQNSWENALQTAADIFTSTVENTVKTFKDTMAGAAGSADALERSYKQQKELSSLYIKDYEKIYELSKLTRDITNSMDSTDSIRGKERLREIQEEINELQESGAEMTEYEVNELRAKYELRLAEIALEEAQNAKSQVRMQRDASGNWSYVYTADQDQVDQAQQNYEDKLYAYQTLTDEYLAEMQDKIIALPGQMAEEMAALRREDYASEIEYQAALDEIRNYYNELYQYYLEETNGAIANSKQFYEEDWTSYAEHSDYKISKDGEWITHFSDTIASQVTGFETAEEAQILFNEASSELLTELSDAYVQWKDDVDTAMNLAGTSMTDFGSTVSTTVNDTILPENEKAKKDAEELREKYSTEFEKILQEAGNFSAKYGPSIQDTLDKNMTLASSINSILLNYQGIVSYTPTITGAYEKITAAAKAAYDAQNLLDANPDTNAGKDPIETYTSGGTKVTITEEQAKLIGAGSYGLYYIPGTNLTFRSAQYEEIKAHFGFDTGGYTGSWGSDGRLAMLHQKEIVLNAHDTENFLAGIDILRAITKAIDLQAIAQSNALSGMMRATVAQTNAQTIQQEVTIHAEFPNATNHSEIEEAFETLLTRSTQFANRKI